jgi:D-3-phosphoglycerate dehydrogenase
MKILVADQFPQRHISALEKAAPDLRVVYRPELNARDLEGDALSDVSVLIVRSTEVSAQAITTGPVLTLIVRAGAGVNTIDTAAASERGIYVANCPGKNSIAVAELAMGLILAFDRQIPQGTADLKAGKWQKSLYSQAEGLYGRTLGLIGVGAIARLVIQRAHAFGMRLVVSAPELTDDMAERLGVQRAASVKAVFERADIVSLHLPLAKDTRNLIGADELGALRPGGLLVNTSRAEVVDREALTAALADENRGLRYATDVFHDEPKGGKGAFFDPIVQHQRVIGTHHIGASTEQAQDAIAEEAVHIVRTFLRSGDVPSCVNIIRRSPARWQLIVRHYDKVGVLANVLGLIKRHDINVEELENTIFEGAKAACARIRLARKPDDELLADVRAMEHDVMHAELVALPES